MNAAPVPPAPPVPLGAGAGVELAVELVGGAGVGFETDGSSLAR